MTSILSDCFGGNTYTSLILTCSKSEYNINKTKQLFKLAKNAQKIKNSYEQAAEFLLNEYQYNY